MVENIASDGWEVDLIPEPRHVGATGICVPDLVLRNVELGLAIAIELFHSWHQGLLERRLDDLSSRPDPHLFLGVDRGLFSKDGLRPRLEESPHVFSFNKFPSEREIRKILRSFH